MADDQITVVAWEPTPSQQRVALMLRDGWSRQKAADAVGITWSTVQKWCDHNPQFVAYVDAMRQEMLSNQAQRFAKLLESWQEIMQEVADGKRLPTDKLARHAEAQLQRTLYRVYVARAGVAVAR